MWRAGFGRGFGPVVRQTAKRMNENRTVLNPTNCICNLNHLLLRDNPATCFGTCRPFSERNTFLKHVSQDVHI